jgi:hypothetical protein
MSWGRLEQKTYRLLGQTRRRADVKDITEECEEPPLEVSRPAVVGAELGL